MTSMTLHGSYYSTEEYMLNVRNKQLANLNSKRNNVLNLTKNLIIKVDRYDSNWYISTLKNFTGYVSNKNIKLLENNYEPILLKETTTNESIIWPVNSNSNVNSLIRYHDYSTLATGTGISFIIVVFVFAVILFLRKKPNKKNKIIYNRNSELPTVPERFKKYQKNNLNFNHLKNDENRQSLLFFDQKNPSSKYFNSFPCYIHF